MSNPYTSSKATSKIPKSRQTGSQGKELATLGERFLGALIDGVVAMIVAIPLLFLFLPLIGLRFGDAGLRTNIGFILGGMIISMIVFVAIHGYLLATRGQTVGKFVMETQIASDETGQKLPAANVIGLRYFIMMVLYNIPYLGGLISLANALFIFRESRKCIHDEIAKTIVIKYVE